MTIIVQANIFYSYNSVQARDFCIAPIDGRITQVRVVTEDKVVPKTHLKTFE